MKWSTKPLRVNDLQSGWHLVGTSWRGWVRGRDSTISSNGFDLFVEQPSLNQSLPW